MKRKSPYQNYWILFIAAWVGFATKGFMQYDNNHKAYQTVRSAMSGASVNLNNLSQEEQNRIYELRNKVYQIITEHLYGQEKEEYASLIGKSEKTDMDFERMNILFNKVKPQLSEKEKEIFVDFYELVKKFSDIKINAKLF